MSGDWGRPDLTVDGVHRGEEFELVLPNFATAGFQWLPTFDEADFALLEVERRGESCNQLVFRFRAVASAGKIRFVLARPGRPPHETRIYTISVTDP